MKNGISVTVICLAYNHRPYIKKALDGFAMQKTSFKFEVIVHDDASTDGTADIIRQYEKYDWLKPYYQKINQYQQGHDIMKFILPLVNGDYIAYCEGDDYWTDENKLQVLYDFMKEHADCSMCCHSYNNINSDSERIICEVDTLENDGDIPIETNIMYKKPTQLASQMFKRDVVMNMPLIFCNRGVGDYTLLLYASTCGTTHFIKKNMANHRIASKGSWTNRVYKNRLKRMKHYDSMISFLNDFNVYTSFKHNDVIAKRIDDYSFNKLISSHNYKLIWHSPFFKRCSIKRKIMTFFGLLFPRLINMIDKG